MKNMSKFSKVIMLAAAVSVAAACSDKARIDAEINQAASSEVVVKKLNVNKFEVLDTVAVDASGKFSYAIEVEKGQPEFVYLFHGDKKVASLLLSEGEKVHVSADTLGNYTVSGSEESAKLAEVEKDIAKKFPKSCIGIYFYRSTKTSFYNRNKRPLHIVCKDENVTYIPTWKVDSLGY